MIKCAFYIRRWLFFKKQIFALELSGRAYQVNEVIISTYDGATSLKVDAFYGTYNTLPNSYEWNITAETDAIMPDNAEDILQYMFGDDSIVIVLKGDSND